MLASENATESLKMLKYMHVGIICEQTLVLNEYIRRQTNNMIFELLMWWGIKWYPVFED